MIDGNQLREEFGRYLAEHKATRWGMDAALMHVCKIAYDAGKADGPGAVLHSREYEIEVPAEPGLHPLKFTGLPLQNWRDEQLAAIRAARDLHIIEPIARVEIDLRAADLADDFATDDRLARARLNDFQQYGVAA